jgi:hypothetical protein
MCYLVYLTTRIIGIFHATKLPKDVKESQNRASNYYSKRPCPLHKNLIKKAFKNYLNIDLLYFNLTQTTQTNSSSPFHEALSTAQATKQ